MKNIIRIDRGTIAAFAFGLTLLGACASPATNKPAVSPTPVPEIQVKSIPVQKTDLSSALTYAGDVKSRATLTIVPRASGRIEKMNVDVGSRVKVGDVIAELDKVTGTLTLRQNEAALAGANARLTTLTNGARQENVDIADANARAARSRTESLTNATRSENVVQADVVVDNARQRLAAMQSGRVEQIAAADAAVSAAQARLDALAKGTTPDRIRAAEILVEQARKAHTATFANRDGQCSFPGNPACDQARATTVQAEASIRQAEAQVAILKKGPTDAQVAELQAALEAAQRQAELVRRPANPLDIASAEASVRAAEAAAAGSRRPVLAGDIDVARAQAEAAQAGAALAAKPFTAEDIASQQAIVNQAQSAVDLTRAQLKDLTITSPVDGIVSERLLVVGAVASPVTPIVAIVSPELEVTVPVEESQLSKVKVGQTARINVPAFPGKPFTGKVTSIAPTVDAKSRTAQVKVLPEPEAFGKLLPGMFAQVSLVLDSRTGILAVPRAAILPGREPAVMAVVSGTVKRVPIKTGLSTNDLIEVTEGLKEGDQVIIDAIDLRDGDRVAVASR